jgi:hemolysin activation/secretion protein
VKNICCHQYIYKLRLFIFIGCLPGFYLFTKLDKTFAQSTPPSGITIPPDTPERIEQTIPKPNESPLPPNKIPGTPEIPPLQTPTNEQPQAPSPTTERFLLKEIKVVGNTVLKDKINKIVNEAVHDNFTGFGDRLNLEYGFSEGINIYNISYKLPVNPLDGKFNVRYSNNSSQIIESPFDDLGIRSDSETLAFSFRQPLVRKPQSEFAVGVGLDMRRSQTFLLDDIPFSFSEGPENGESRVTAIRFFQDWVNRDTKKVLAMRSQFNFGIDAFDATVNDSGTDGRFFSWLGQFQWVQQISPRMLILTRIDTQLISCPVAYP